MRAWSVLLVCGVLVSCGKPAKDLEPAPALSVVAPVDRGAVAGEALRATVDFVSDRQAIAPVRLATRRVTTTADLKTKVTFDALPWSTRGAWVRFSLTDPRTALIDGVSFSLRDGVVLPMAVSGRAVELTLPAGGEVGLEVVGTIDTWGGGFVRDAPSARAEREVLTTARFDDDGATPAPDDTFSRLVRVELRADAPAQVALGRCAAGDEPGVVDLAVTVTADAPVKTTAWLDAGPLCLRTSAKVSAAVTSVGRVRRFATSALRAVKPLRLLDTVSGAGGWKGTPLADQELRVALDGLSGDAAATDRLVLATTTSGGVLRVGACAGAREEVQSGALVLLPRGDVCVESPLRGDVALTLVAVVTPRSDAVACTVAAREPLAACQATDLLGRLNCLPGITATTWPSTGVPFGVDVYLLRITQPVDHFHPEGPTFTQRALLKVRDEAAPVVLHTTGYELFDFMSDLASNFPVNEVELEHRFFEDSTPQPLDYSVLTVMQSAADSHRVVERLAPLFQGRWANTGHSKGGMTALYHRRFFPCDVVASAPYVTPLSLGKQDARYGPWLAQLGGPTYARCREVMVELERGVVGGITRYAPRLRGTYARVGGREHAIWAANSGTGLWSAFQMGTQDDPQDGCPFWEPLLGTPEFPQYVDQYAAYGEWYADASLAQYPLDGYSFQTQNELGSPGGNRAHLEEFGPIPQLPDDGALLFGSVPLPTFEPRAMLDVQQWLKVNGEHFLFLYGSFDPWTAGQVDVEGARDTRKVIVGGLHHGVGLLNLTDATRTEVFALVEGWLGVSRLKRAQDQAPRQYRDVMHRHHL